MIREEIQRVKKSIKPSASEPFGNAVAHVKYLGSTNAADEKWMKEMEREIIDLQIANRGKDYLIEN